MKRRALILLAVSLLGLSVRMSTACPTETLISQDISYDNPYYGAIEKDERKSIAFDDGTENVPLNGHGEYGTTVNCNLGTSTLYCWPLYLTPTITSDCNNGSTTWSQTVVWQATSCQSFWCNKGTPAAFPIYSCDTCDPTGSVTEGTNARYCSDKATCGGDPCANFDYTTCSYNGGNGTVDGSGISGGACCGPSPVLIDLSGGGFHLTDAEDGVNFDLDSDGVAERIGWTAPGSSLGFLCLDRNGNGMIDNGRELFGNHTPQPPSQHPNGFLALAVYDQPANGGNGDGIIDNRDAIFSQLRIWVDGNHNGVSEPGELHTLPDVGVTAISLNYSYSFRRDEFGNRFRYFARVFDARGAHDGPLAYDVYFVRGK